MEYLSGHFNYYACSTLFCLGLFLLITTPSRIKKLFGLAMLQTAVMLLFISLGNVTGGRSPIITDPSLLYSNPLPHVLMLTAIVVGLATLSVGLALLIRLKKFDEAADVDL